MSKQYNDLTILTGDISFNVDTTGLNLSYGLDNLLGIYYNQLAIGVPVQINQLALGSPVKMLGLDEDGYVVDASAYNSISVADAQNLSLTSGFIPGVTYRIYDAGVANNAPGSLTDDGSSGFITQAINTSQLSESGSWSFMTNNRARGYLMIECNWGTGGTFDPQDILTLEVDGTNILSAPITYTPGSGNAATFANDIRTNINAGTGTHGWSCPTILFRPYGDEVLGIYRDIIVINLRSITASSASEGLTISSTYSLPVADTSASEVSPGLTLYGTDPERITLDASYNLSLNWFTRAYDSLNEIEITGSPDILVPSSKTIHSFPWRQGSTKMWRLKIFNSLFRIGFGSFDASDINMINTQFDAVGSSCTITLQDSTIENAVFQLGALASSVNDGSGVGIAGSNVSNCEVYFNDSVVSTSSRIDISSSLCNNTTFDFSNSFYDKNTNVVFGSSTINASSISMYGIQFESSLIDLYGLDAKFSDINLSASQYNYMPTLTQLYGWYRGSIISTRYSLIEYGSLVMDRGKILLDFFCPAVAKDSGFQLLLGGSTFNNSFFSTGPSALSSVPTRQTFFDFRRTLFKASSISLGSFDAYTNSGDYISISTYFKEIKGSAEYYSTIIDSTVDLSGTTIGVGAAIDINLLGSTITNSNFKLTGNTLGKPGGVANNLLIDLFRCDLSSVNIDAYSLNASESAAGVSIILYDNNLSNVNIKFYTASLSLTSDFTVYVDDSTITNSEVTVSTGSAAFVGGDINIINSSVNNSSVGLMTVGDRGGFYNYETYNSIVDCLISNSYVKFDQGVSSKLLQDCNICNAVHPGIYVGNTYDHWLLLQDPLDPLITYYQYQDMTLKGNEIEIDVKYNATGGFGTGIDYDLSYFIPPRVSFNEIHYGESLNWVTGGANVEVFEQQDLFTLKLTTNNLFDYRTPPENTDAFDKTTQINRLYFRTDSNLAAGAGQQLSFTLKGRRLNF